MIPWRGKTFSSHLSCADLFCFATCSAEYCQTASKGLRRPQSDPIKSFLSHVAKILLSVEKSPLRCLAALFNDVGSWAQWWVKGRAKREKQKAWEGRGAMEVCRCQWCGWAGTAKCISWAGYRKRNEMLERPHAKGPSATSLFGLTPPKCGHWRKGVGSSQCSHGSGTLGRELRLFPIYLRLLL